MTEPYDALLVVSFGGPESMDEVMPFLRNVVRGKSVPEERLKEVARHYEHFGGVSPLNSQNRALIKAIREELGSHGPPLPVYWGNRNWHPFLADTLRTMANDGIARALAFFTSAYSSYSGCRQYLENIEYARSEVGPSAPRVDKLRVFYNHPGFIEPQIEHVRKAFDRVPESRREKTPLLFSAHSIPRAMASTSEYVAQLEETSRLVAQGGGWAHGRLVYQSRSGPPHIPWLEPDIGDVLTELGEQGAREVVVAPIGFLSDHMEVVYDLDIEAKARAERSGVRMIRAASVGTHPRFLRMIRELIVERMTDHPVRLALGDRGPRDDVCPEDCCPGPSSPRA